MKIFVISDTHRQLDKVIEVFHMLSNVDLILHLGDYERDAAALEQELETEVISVKGNMDGSYSGEDFKILDTECGKLLLTHGHMDNVKSSPLNLYYKAKEQGCIAALFGHTHRPHYEEYDGVYLVNPGSLPYSRDGSQGSYAIINTEPDGFHCSIVYYSSTNAKKKPQKGILRDLLNNSDRF